MRRIPDTLNNKQVETFIYLLLLYGKKPKVCRQPVPTAQYMHAGADPGGFKGFHGTLPFERASLTRDALIEQSQYS